MDKKSMKQSSILSFFGKSPKSACGNSPASSNGKLANGSNGNTNGNTPSSSSSKKLDIKTPKSGETISGREVKSRPKRLNLESSDGENGEDDVKPAMKKAKLDQPERTNSSDEDNSPVKKAAAATPGMRKRKAVIYSSDEEDNCKDTEVFDDQRSSSKFESHSAKKATPGKTLNNGSFMAKLQSGAKKATPGKTLSAKTPTRPSTKSVGSPAVTAKSKASSSKSSYEVSDGDAWPHLTWEWLKPENLKDKNMRKVSHPEYNPMTLYVPADFLKSCTPAQKQWWMFKKHNFDTVLFFKMGKFYELYHMDAVIANRELGIMFMKGTVAHNGFPEQVYSNNASILIQKGYKTARIEQVETPLMLQQRCKKQGKGDKVVNRAVCEISTKGVRMPSFQNADSLASSQSAPDATYFYTIIENLSSASQNDEQSIVPEYGVCFVDTTVGKFTLGQFTDGVNRARLTSLFAKHPPAQVVYCKTSSMELISPETKRILANMTDVRVEAIQSKKKWVSQDSIEFLIKEKIFQDVNTKKHVFPDVMDYLFYLDQNEKEDESSLLISKLVVNEADWGYALAALWGAIKYLADCRSHIDLLTLGRFELYHPVENINDIPSKNDAVSTSGKFLTLDAGVLKTLEILEGPNNILSVLDRCRTAFGKRLLKMWVCQPLGNAESITRRLDAVEDLMNLAEVSEKLTSTLTSVPDLERLVNKMHILGSEHRSKMHPDGQAQLFEIVKYSKNKILDFVNLLRGMKKCRLAINSMRDVKKQFKSELILDLLNDYPNLEEFFEYFDRAFNPDAAVKEGRIIPLTGSCPEYDMALEEIDGVNEEAANYLKQLCKEYNYKVEYFGSDKKRFQINLPENKRVPNSFKMSSSKKGFKRYTNSTTEDFLQRLTAAEVKRDAVLSDVTRQMFWRFDQSRDLWIKAIKLISILDAVMSLAKYSKSQEGMCRPKVVDAEHPFLKVVQGRHPAFLSKTYIPNDCSMASSELEGGDGNFILLTGANMGGKSTLMRQVGLLAILSHIGCYVPADVCELSTVDRVFTRIGANDNIAGGESTFQVEVSEAAAILKYKTKNSLVLIDELGRGTATYDGLSIAQAVATHLAGENIRTVFATHYHSLAYAMGNVDSVQLKHMAFEVKTVKEGNSDVEKLTFLYVMADGHCDKSYGFHAARISGIQQSIVAQAEVMGQKFEEGVTEVTLFRSYLMEAKALMEREHNN